MKQPCLIPAFSVSGTKPSQFHPVSEASHARWTFPAGPSNGTRNGAVHGSVAAAMKIMNPMPSHAIPNGLLFVQGWTASAEMLGEGRSSA